MLQTLLLTYRGVQQQQQRRVTEGSADGCLEKMADAASILERLKADIDEPSIAQYGKGTMPRDAKVEVN